MEFEIDRNELAVAVTNTVHGVPNNPVTPIYAGMNIDSVGAMLQFAASDGDVTFTSTALAKYSEDGNVTVPGRLFADIVRSLPDKPVHFACDGDHATVVCGRSQFKFPVYKQDYPGFPEPAGNYGSIDGAVFADMVRKVVCAASKSDSNPALASVLFEPDGDTLYTASTDRYRLACMNAAWESSGAVKSALVPSWAVERFTRGVEGTVTLGWDDRVVTLAAGSYQVTSRLIQGEFPKAWRGLLPATPCDITVDTAELLAALKRAQIASEQDSPVELTFQAAELRVEAGYGNHADDVVDATYTGDPVKALFGIGMLVDGLSGCGDTASFGFSEPLKLHIQSGNYTYTLMPRRKL